MAGELIGFGNRVSKLADPASVHRVLLAGGMAAKKASLDAAEKDLGSDRAFSGLKRKVKLSAGFDDVGTTQIQLNLRPRGLWMLAEHGRRSGKPIRPKGKQALYWPGASAGLSASSHPLASSTVGRWGGKNTYSDAVREARQETPRAAFRQFQVEVAKVVR